MLCLISSLIHAVTRLANHTILFWWCHWYTERVAMAAVGRRRNIATVHVATECCMDLFAITAVRTRKQICILHADLAGLEFQGENPQDRRACSSESLPDQNFFYKTRVKMSIFLGIKYSDWGIFIQLKNTRPPDLSGREITGPTLKSQALGLRSSGISSPV